MRFLLSPLALFLAAALALAPPARGQFFSAEAPTLQVGLSGAPRLGLQVAYLQPRTVFTLEAALYADVQAPFSEVDDRRFQAAGAVGGAVRLLRIAQIVAGVGPGGDLDVGLRGGPGLGFKSEETLADRNQRFRLLLDPFARYVRRVGPLQLFGEVGLARPRLRGGVWFRL